MAMAERLERISNQVLETRSRIIETVFQGTGVIGVERENYDVRILPGLKPIDEKTAQGDLMTIGLVGIDGLVNIPVLVAAQRGLEDKIDRLRVKFDGNPGDSGDAMQLSLWIAPVEEFGDFVELGDLYLYPDRRADRVDWYITDDMSHRGTGLVKNDQIVGGIGLKMEHRQSANAAGRAANRIFGVDLPEEAKLFFKQDGRLRTELEMGPVRNFLARRVDLNREHLSAPEKQRFTKALALLRNEAIAINDWLGNEFDLVEDQYKGLKLEGDIEVEALRLTDPEHPSLKSTVIRIRNILLPEPGRKAPWTQLVRPKENDFNGTLKIIIYSDGSFSSTVEIGGVGQEDINTKDLVTTENLAAILAKITVR